MIFLVSHFLKRDFFLLSQNLKLWFLPVFTVGLFLFLISFLRESPFQGNEMLYCLLGLFLGISLQENQFENDERIGMQVYLRSLPNAKICYYVSRYIMNFLAWFGFAMILWVGFYSSLSALDCLNLFLFCLGLCALHLAIQKLLCAQKTITGLGVVMTLPLCLPLFVLALSDSLNSLISLGLYALLLSTLFFLTALFE